MKNPENVAKLSDFGFNTGDVDVLKDVHRRICNDQSPNYHQPLSKSDAAKMFAAVQGLQQELQTKLAGGKLGGTNAELAKQTIGRLNDVRDRLQTSQTFWDAVKKELATGDAAGVIARSDFCNLVKSPGSTAKLPDLGFSSNLVDVLIGTYRRFCREDNPPQFLLTKQFSTNIVTI